MGNGPGLIIPVKWVFFLFLLLLIAVGAVIEFFFRGTLYRWAQAAWDALPK